MSLSNFFFADLEEDPIFGHTMNSMRQMQNHMMSNMLTDPFRMLGGMGGGMSFGGLVPRMNMNMSQMMHPGMNMNMNRLLSGPENGVSYSSSSSISVMSSGSDGRPQVYHETSSVRKGPGGLKETRHTVQDSSTGKKKMAIGHHLGEKGHVVEKEQNLHTGHREEREDFINLDESDTEEFERDFQQKARQSHGSRPRLQIEEIGSEPLRAIRGAPEAMRAIQGAPEPLRAAHASRPRVHIEEISSEPLPTVQSSEDVQIRNRLVTPRRSYQNRPPLLSPTSPVATATHRREMEPSLHPHPYHPQSRKMRGSKVKGQHSHHQ